MRLSILLALTLLLTGCMEQAYSRVGLLSLLPFMLTIVVLWLLNRNRSEDEKWDEDHYPDDDDDENEDHHLM
jgi:hypothetical protein